MPLHSGILLTIERNESTVFIATKAQEMSILSKISQTWKIKTACLKLLKYSS